jgi:hypothetical protein
MHASVLLLLDFVYDPVCNNFPLVVLFWDNVTEVVNNAILPAEYY